MSDGLTEARHASSAKVNKAGAQRTDQSNGDVQWSVGGKSVEVNGVRFPLVGDAKVRRKIGERIKEAKQRLGLTAIDVFERIPSTLAERAEFKKTTVNDLVHANVRFTQGRAEALAYALEVPVSWFFETLLNPRSEESDAEEEELSDVESVADAGNAEDASVVNVYPDELLKVAEHQKIFGAHLELLLDLGVDECRIKRAFGSTVLPNEALHAGNCELSPREIGRFCSEFDISFRQFHQLCTRVWDGTELRRTLRLQED